MRILFDHGTPVPLRRILTGQDVFTAYEMGWTELDNGALLDRAEAGFDALVTTDQISAINSGWQDERWRSWCCPRPVGRSFRLMQSKLLLQWKRCDLVILCN